MQSVYNKFIVVVTNLPEEIEAGQILELYRMRWQIELVFKRLKSILDYDKLQTKTGLTSRARLHCKLLTAAICELYVQRGAFSPQSATTENISRLSLWQAYEVVYDVLTYLLLATSHADAFFQEPEKLRDACSQSKRKRTLTLVSFSLQVAFI